mmetsp:Transcript_46423/g.115548  ORF Transcript_46423/g.115548 Transcript_46423/m.115548 type:complete len:217 (+) Transcript_46423:300-950(+)
MIMSSSVPLPPFLPPLPLPAAAVCEMAAVCPESSVIRFCSSSSARAFSRRRFLRICFSTLFMLGGMAGLLSFDSSSPPRNTERRRFFLMSKSASVPRLGCGVDDDGPSVIISPAAAAAAVRLPFLSECRRSSMRNSPTPAAAAAGPSWSIIASPNPAEDSSIATVCCEEDDVASISWSLISASFCAKMASMLKSAPHDDTISACSCSLGCSCGGIV